MTNILCVSVEYSSPRYKSLMSVRAAFALAPAAPLPVVVRRSSRASSAVCTSHCRDSSLSDPESLPMPPIYKGEFWKYKEIVKTAIKLSRTQCRDTDVASLYSMLAPSAYLFEYTSSLRKSDYFIDTNKQFSNRFKNKMNKIIIIMDANLQRPQSINFVKIIISCLWFVIDKTESDV